MLPLPKWECSSIPHFLIAPHKPPHNLRLSRDVLKLLMFHVPNGSGVIVPFLWQHLTGGIIEISAAPSVNIFKSLLKTHLSSH